MSEGPATPRLSIADVAVRRGGRTILRSVTLDVAAGESVAIIGASGSGKTTLLRAVAGLQSITDGSIRIDGAVVSRPGWEQPAYSRGVGMVFQRSALWPHMTVAQNVRFAAAAGERPDVGRTVSELLEAMGIADLADRFPDQISGGEGRRAALARALAARPRILLMDEPLTGVDAPRKDGLLSLIRSVVGGETATGRLDRPGASTSGESSPDRGGASAGDRPVERTTSTHTAIGPAMLYVTHDPIQARDVAHRVVRLEDGRLVS